MRLLFLAGFSLAASQASAEPLSLDCKGQISSLTIYKDGRIKRDNDESKIFAVVDDNQNTIRIDGDWGCPESKSCSVDMFAAIDQDRIVFVVKGKFFDEYPFSASASVNRLTGVMESNAIVDGRDPATWVRFSRKGVFECQKVTGRKF